MTIKKKPSVKIIRWLVLADEIEKYALLILGISGYKKRIAGKPEKFDLNIILYSSQPGRYH
jgi:hypothetical protein